MLKKDMLTQTTLNHFNSIASTWQEKGWVHSRTLNGHIHRFLRETEKESGLDKKRFKSSIYFGIGTGALFHSLNKYAVAGIDEAADMLGKCPEGIVQILSKVEELPFLMDNQFNLTFSRNLLKHCIHPQEAVNSMYKKTREGGVAVLMESVVLTEQDRHIPTQLVRMTDPEHPAFLTHEEIRELFLNAGFRQVEIHIQPYRSAWFRKWLKAEQGNAAITEEVLKIYQHAPEDFLKRHQVIIQKEEITSTVPWLFLRARK